MLISHPTLISPKSQRDRPYLNMNKFNLHEPNSQNSENERTRPLRQQKMSDKKRRLRQQFNWAADISTDRLGLFVAGEDLRHLDGSKSTRGSLCQRPRRWTRVQVKCGTFPHTQLRSKTKCEEQKNSFLHLTFPSSRL